MTNEYNEFCTKRKHQSVYGIDMYKTVTLLLIVVNAAAAVELVVVVHVGFVIVVVVVTVASLFSLTEKQLRITQSN